MCLVTWFLAVAEKFLKKKFRIFYIKERDFFFNFTKKRVKKNYGGVSVCHIL